MRSLVEFSVAVAVLSFCSACSVATDPPGAFDRSSFEYRIDPAFTPEQADAIRLGMAFWAAEMPGADLVELDAPPGGCEPGGAGQSRHCFVAMPEGCDALTEPGETYAGRQFPSGWVAILDSLEGEELALVTAHEFGHRLGLQHTNLGIMAESIGDALDWRLSTKAIGLLESRGWR